jgi:hypothetical protein
MKEAGADILTHDLCIMHQFYLKIESEVIILC